MNGHLYSVRTLAALSLAALASVAPAQVSSGGSSASGTAAATSTSTRPAGAATTPSAAPATGTAVTTPTGTTLNPAATGTTTVSPAAPGTTTLNPVATGTTSATGRTRGTTTLNPVATNPPTTGDAGRTTLNPVMDLDGRAVAPRRTTLNPFADNPPTPTSPGAQTTLNRAGQVVRNVPTQLIQLSDGTVATLLPGATPQGTDLLGSGLFLPTSMAGVFVTPLEQSGEWVLVRRADGREGWMPVSVVPALARSTSSQLDIGGQMVLGRSLTLFHSLDVEGAGSARAMAGDTIVVLQRSGDWLLVRAPNGTRGWVLEDMLVGLGPRIEQRIQSGTLDTLLPNS